MEAVTDVVSPMPCSYAEQLRAKFWALKKSRVRVSNALTTRASAIGDPCERRLFYSRTASELAIPHRPELQAIFDLGKELETYVVHELEAMGLEVTQRERDYLDRTRELSAHSDAKVRAPGWPLAITTEIKGLNPYTAESIETIEDIRSSRQPWVRKYYDQLQSYLHFDDGDAGLFALLNKVTGAITFIDCPRDEERIAELLAKAERIRDAVRADEPPPRNEVEGECERCAFQHVCMPNRSFGPGVQVLDSAEVERLIERKLELANAAREAAAVDRALKGMLPEAPELLVGGFAVTAKQIHRAGYTVAPGSYWQRKFTRITGGEH